MLAQTSQPLITNASDCDSLARACSAAAKELRAARDLIKGYEQHIEAADERIEIARKEIGSLRRIGQLEHQRANELQTVIDAERKQVELLLKQKELMEGRIKTLEGQLKRSRKFTLILGVAAGIGILIAVGK